MNNLKARSLDTMQTERLPVLPQVLLEVIRACHDPRLGLHQLAELVSQDAALAGRVLSAANASLYGQAATVTSVERALQTLGTHTLRTLAITLSIQQLFQEVANPPRQVLGEFWRRSLTSALLAKALAILTSYPRPEEAYLAGLIHNIGELVLNLQFGERFQWLKTQAADEEQQVAEERSQLGTDHPEAGVRLVANWHLPSHVLDALRYHHQPLERIQDAQPLTKLVYLASLLGMPGPSSNASLLAADRLFGLMPPLVQEICERIEQEVDTQAQRLQLDVPNSLRQAKRALSRELHVIGLLQAASSHLLGAISDQEAQMRARQAAEILFQSPQSLLFIADGDSLVLSHPLPPDPAQTLRIQMYPGRSLIADAMLQAQVIQWWPEQETLPEQVIDRQILHRLCTPGFACLPLRPGDKPGGVLVLGLNQPLNLAQRQLLRLFGDEVVRHCAARTGLLAAPGPHAWQSEGRQLRVAIREAVHEASNPLSIIRNYLEVLARDLEGKQAPREDLQIIREEVDRTARILLDLSRAIEPSSTPGAVQINRVVEKMTTLFRNSLFASRGIECSLDMDEQIPLVQSDEAALRQVLTNLLKNAAEALSPGGRIQIQTQDFVNMNGKAYIEIRIGDNGPGLPPEVQEHLFQPGFSTKSDGHAGLGLSIVRNLMSSMGGTISCHSSRRGTEFRLLIPRVPVTATGTPIAALPGTYPGRHALRE